MFLKLKIKIYFLININNNKKETIMKRSKIEKFINEMTVSGDISQYPELIKPILYKVYTESLVSEIADVQPLKSPVGKVYTLFSSYGGKTGDHINSTNSTIIVLTTNSSVAGASVTSVTGTGTVIHSEDNKILVKILTGYFAIGQTIGTAEILDVITNRNYIRRTFKSYSGPLSTGAGEQLAQIPSVSHELIGKTLEVKTRKLKSKVSQEFIEDLRNIYGEDFAKDVLENEFASEIIQSIDSEIISYLKSIASPVSDVILSESLGMQSGIAALSEDIYANLYKLTIDIMRNTKRKKNFFVLADAATTALLLNSPLHAKPQADKTNTYFMGKVGGLFDLYMDPYSVDHYVLVGYKSEDAELGDAGLIFAPYMNTINEAVETETGKYVFFNTMRYDYTCHPQDTTTGNSDSIFFKMFNVNMENVPNLINMDNTKR